MEGNVFGRDEMLSQDGRVFWVDNWYCAISLIFCVCVNVETEVIQGKQELGERKMTL